MEDNALEGYPIYRPPHQSINVEDTDTNTSTNQQQDIVEIEPTDGSYFEGIDVRESDQ